MIYQKHYNIRGILLIDIMIAFSLALLFIVAVTSATAYSRDIFYQAKSKEQILDVYETNLASGNGGLNTRPYGNDREETAYSSSTFVSIQLARDVVTGISSQYPLCSVDFTDNSTVGSFDWWKYQTGMAATAVEGPSNIRIYITQYPLPIPATIPLTHLEVRGNIAYVSTDSNVTSDPDLYIIKLPFTEGSSGADSLIVGNSMTGSSTVSNSTVNGSSILSSINTGPGIVDFSIVGKYIYAVAPSTAAELHIIRQDLDHALSLVKKYQLSLPYATATPALGSSIAFSNNYIYLGTEKWAGEEFNVIDVTNPISPVRRSGMEMNTRVGDIFVNGGKAYISSPDQQQLKIMDISDPTHPVTSNGFSPSGWQRQEGTVSSIFEGRLDFGRTSGGYNVTTDYEAFTFATSSPFNPYAYKSVDMPGGIYGILSDRSYDYMITRQAGKEFQIFGHSSNASLSLRLALPTLPQSMTCYRDKIYILSHTSLDIYQIQIMKNY